MANLGESDYRDGAMERLVEAQRLREEEQFAGSIYLAGRGVEGMLRAVLWKKDRTIREGRRVLETGHDLRSLLKEIGNLGLLRTDDRDEAFRAGIQKIGRLWFNDMRFVSTQFVERRWRRLGELHGRRTMKRASDDYYAVCLDVVKRCEVLWSR
jgi:hypothetical protein